MAATVHGPSRIDMHGPCRCGVTQTVTKATLARMTDSILASVMVIDVWKCLLEG